MGDDARRRPAVPAISSCARVGAASLVLVCSIAGLPASAAQFEEISARAGVLRQGFSYSLAWGDFDNDGDLDLFVANGCETEPNDPSVLYRNNGNGTFTIVTRDAGLFYTGNTEGTAWADT